MPEFLIKNKRVLTPLLVLAVSVSMYVGLTLLRSSPQTAKQAEQGVLVEVLSVTKTSAAIRVEGNGTVQALRQVSIGSQVAGRVDYLAPALVRGGFVKSGDELFRIEAADYRLRVEAAKAEVARAEQELEVVQANAKVAEEEWGLVEKLSRPGEEDSAPPRRSALQMFKPQLKTARAALASAKAALTQATLNLERTVIKAPFNSFVLEKKVELGQFVNLGQATVELVGTDAVEVFVPVTASESRWLRRAMKQNRKDSLPAQVETSVDEDVIQWSGFVDRVLGEVDSRGRMHRAVVRVTHPYFQADSGEKHLAPLSIGMFTNVTIEAGVLDGIFKIPRSAVRSKQTVWVVDAENRLRIRDIGIKRRDTEFAYVEQGLVDGDRLIVSPVGGAVDGLLVRVDSSSERTQSL